MTETTNFHMKNPPHPGAFVGVEIIEPAELFLAAAADALEGSSVSGRGLRVEKAFGVSMDTLMRMQSSYNIAQARKRKGKIKVAPYRPVANIPNPKQPTLI